MKSKDIFSLVIIAFIAAIFSFVVSGKIFGTSKHNLKAPEVQAIDSSFPDNNPSSFNTSQ
jgi:hypothetical protein